MHGLPALAGFPIFVLTIVMGVLVIASLYAMNSRGYWLVMAYMAYLLVVPPLVVGKSISLFASVFWPLIVMVYLFVKRRDFGVGTERPTSASTQTDRSL